MDMEQFKAQLKELAGSDGEKAWKLVEDWYTRNGKSRRLSLHDLHELSQAVASYSYEIRLESIDAINWDAIDDEFDLFLKGFHDKLDVYYERRAARNGGAWMKHLIKAAILGTEPARDLLPETKPTGGANTLAELISLLKIARDNKTGVSLDWVETGIALRNLAEPAQEEL